MNTCDKIISNSWKNCSNGSDARMSAICNRTSSIEGIDVNRYDARLGGNMELANNDGHIISVISGAALLASGHHEPSLRLGTGAHVYLPPGSSGSLSFLEDSGLIHVAADALNSRGDKLLIHDERFLGPTRFVLTQQYLSRRIFLHRDKTLTSKSGDPVAWFHTTMFDTEGLPTNNDGLEVFKMSYDYQTEINVVYNVRGKARVRFAHHPYTSPSEQLWTDWAEINDETTYCLNESADGNHIERRVDPVTAKTTCLRNRHEIYIEPKGHVSLCCLFDPGPTGVEKHQPGEYSSYGPVSNTIATKEYEQFLQQTASLDEMVSTLSLFVATGAATEIEHERHWPIYEKAMQRALKAEENLIASSTPTRRAIIEPWRLSSRTY